jgi:hypothetical protein
MTADIIVLAERRKARALARRTDDLWNVSELMIVLPLVGWIILGAMLADAVRRTHP